MLSKYKDVHIVNVDRLSYGANPSNLQAYQKDRRYAFSRGDITDRLLLGQLIRGVDVIVNFAAESHVDRSISDPWPFMRSNTDGVLSILEALRSDGGNVKLVHVGTDEVYGDVQKGSTDEDAKLNPSSPYAASKGAADMLCLAYWRTFGLRVSITRCTNNFGPYQFPEKLIPKAIIRAHMQLKVPVYGKGRNVRDWIYVADHCEALDLVLRSGGSGQVYNIAGHNEIENLKLVKMILKAMGKSDDLVELVEDRPGHDLRYSLDDTKIRRELAWRPRHSLKRALERTVKWYQKNEQWWRPLANKKVLSPSPWKLTW